MDANKMQNITTISEVLSKLTIGDALKLKHVFGLSDLEAAAIFFGGIKHENIQV